MGRIENQIDGTSISLESDVLIGRSSRCTLRMGDSRVSGEHANLRWAGDSWLLKDLGSLNGTAVDGRSLTPGESVLISQGSRFSIGHPSLAWTLVDAGAPAIMAISLDGSPPVLATDGLLVLPSPEQPALTVHRDRHGAWRIEGEGESREVDDQALLRVGALRYRLCLPQVSTRTTPMLGLVGRRVSDLAMTFHPSHDLENIEIELSCGGATAWLGARNHNEMLLVLARVRIEDRARSVCDAECGWLYQDELCKALALEPERVNVDVYRIRRQIAALGLLDPASIVERRSKTRELRIGVDKLWEVAAQTGS